MECIYQYLAPPDVTTPKEKMPSDPVLDFVPEVAMETEALDGSPTNVDPPQNAVSAIPTKKEPPPETPAAIRLRVYVILSFWAIIVIVGLPIWWWTTAIYRADLPLDQMMDWAEGRV